MANYIIRVEVEERFNQHYVDAQKYVGARHGLHARVHGAVRTRPNRKENMWIEPCPQARKPTSSHICNSTAVGARMVSCGLLCREVRRAGTPVHMDGEMALFPCLVSGRSRG